MRITSTGFNPYQTKLRQVKNSEAPKKKALHKRMHCNQVRRRCMKAHQKCNHLQRNH